MFVDVQLLGLCLVPALYWCSIVCYFAKISGIRFIYFQK
jgi:hypothetical protein